MSPEIKITGGKLFLESCVLGTFELNDVNVWARQCNPESGATKVTLNGGSYWSLGLKTELAGTIISATNRAKVEIFGAFIYPN